MSKSAQIPWEILDMMREGENLLKFGRRGEPHFRKFVLSEDFVTLSWDSKKKKDSSQSTGKSNRCKLVCMLISEYVLSIHLLNSYHSFVLTIKIKFILIP